MTTQQSSGASASAPGGEKKTSFINYENTLGEFKFGCGPRETVRQVSGEHPPLFVLLVGTLRVPCRGQRLGTGLELGQPYRRVGLRTPPACVTAVGNTMEGRRGEPRGISWRFRRFRSEGQQGRVR